MIDWMGIVDGVVGFFNALRGAETANEHADALDKKHKEDGRETQAKDDLKQYRKEHDKHRERSDLSL